MSNIRPHILHQFVRNHGRGNVSPRDSASVHKQKEYPRFNTFDLSEPEPLAVSLSETLRNRESALRLNTLNMPSLKTLSSLLGNSLSIHADGRRPAPSGGGLYPIEAYVIAPVTNNEKLQVHHYRPDKHSLEILWGCERADVDNSMKLDENKGAPLYIVLTAIWERSEVQYGDFSYMLGLIEAGAISQNLLLCATALNLSACPVAGFYDARISTLLDIDLSIEQPVLVIGLGK